MRRLTVHLVVALLAFFVGVSAAWIFGAARSTRVRTGGDETFYAPPPPPPAPRKYGCPSERFHHHPPLVEPPPPPPAPPAPPQTSKKVRVVVSADGKVQVVESKTEASAVVTR